MLVQIDGWFGGGKSLLTGLLDGHPELCTFLCHDFSHISLLSHNSNADWILNKQTEDLRRALGRGSNYYGIEREANQGFHTLDFSSNDRIKLPYPVDFYQFDRKFFKELLTLPDWSLEKIIHILYKNLMMELTKDNKRNDLPKYFGSMGFPVLGLQKNFLNIYPSSKSILVKRNIYSIVATRCNRKSKKHHTEQNAYAQEFTDLIESKEVEEIIEYYTYWEEMALKFPARVLIVDFDEIHTNTEKTMKKISDFLEIKFEKILLKWSYLGEEVKCNGKSYVGKELDDAKQLLSAKEFEVIDRRIKKYNRRKKKGKKIKISPLFIWFSKLNRYIGRKIGEYGY